VAGVFSDPLSEGPAPAARTIDGIPLGRFLLRLLWVTVQLLLVLYLGNPGALFFYQGF
jgi:hypothetical protein